MISFPFLFFTLVNISISFQDKIILHSYCYALFRYFWICKKLCIFNRKKKSCILNIDFICISRIFFRNILRLENDLKITWSKYRQLTNYPEKFPHFTNNDWLIVWLFVCMFEAVRTFENSRAKSTCYNR